MRKRYICFICHSFHPEMKGVSEEEFKGGDNVCSQEKCKRRGQPLEPALLCEVCGRIYRIDQNHKH